MAKRPSAANPSKTARIEVACRVAYELGLLLGILTLVLIALSGWATQHVDIDRTVDATHVQGSAPNPGIFHVGESVPIYRFHEDWQQVIGRAKVAKIDGDRITFEYDPNKFRWEMGRHGRVLSVSGTTCRVNLGQQNGFSVGDGLNVFDGRTLVGVVQFIKLGATESTAAILQRGQKIPNALFNGKVVSEYTVATQVVFNNSPILQIVDYLGYVIVVVGYSLLWRKYRGSPFLAILPPLRQRLQPSATVKIAFHAAIGIPILWVLTNFGIRCVGYLIYLTYYYFLHTPMPIGIGTDALLQAHQPLFFLLLIAYEAVLWSKGSSPIGLVLKRIAFRGGIFGHTAKEPAEHVTMWCLQAIIVYTFARTLGGFVQGNFNSGILASWPKAPPVVVPETNPLSLEGFARTLHSIGYALTHAPSPPYEDAMFLSLDSAIYNACILACLVGYAYSLVSYLWGKRIRNVDFTIVGWLTNAVCYGPLFGVVIWQMLPPLIGQDPIVTPGFLRTMTFTIAVTLNAIYTLSIWNLGTMFGVMTDKGVRTSGFYSIVRHPNYTIESVMFVLFYCRELSSVGQWIAVSGFVIIYWLRSEREDQFMGASNPEYLTYREKVPYKFIPGLY